MAYQSSVCGQGQSADVHRRAFLAATGSVSRAGSSDERTNSSAAAAITPVDLDGQKRDDRGGMVIGYHGGPNGQIFDATHTPDGHPNPAWFHSLVFGLFPFYLDHERNGWEETAIDVTDYSRIEYSLDGEGRLPAPTAADTFAHPTAMPYVMESQVACGMCPTLVPLSAPHDATSFVDRYGGRRLTFDEITADLIASYSTR